MTTIPPNANGFDDIILCISGAAVALLLHYSTLWRQDRGSFCRKYRISGVCTGTAGTTRKVTAKCCDDDDGADGRTEDVDGNLNGSTPFSEALLRLEIGFPLMEKRSPRDL